MSNQIIESQLFVALSDEQVEQVAGGFYGGGYGFGNPNRNSGSDYYNNSSAVQGGNSSGPNGSGSTSAAVNNTVSTGTYDSTGNDFFGGGYGGWY